MQLDGCGRASGPSLARAQESEGIHVSMTATLPSLHARGASLFFGLRQGPRCAPLEWARVSASSLCSRRSLKAMFGMVAGRTVVPALGCGWSRYSSVHMTLAFWLV